MKKELYERYKALRNARPRWFAFTVIEHLRHEDTFRTFLWEKEGRCFKKAVLEEKGFTILVEVREDVPEVPYCFGFFCDEKLPGVVPNPLYQKDASAKKYFLSEYGELERYDDYRKYNYGKTEARELARKDVFDNLCAMVYPERLLYVSVEVTFFCLGRVWAWERSSGIQVDNFDARYLNDVANSLVLAGIRDSQLMVLDWMQRKMKGRKARVLC